MVVMFNNLDITIYLMLSLIITSLKDQLMSGTGSPIASHVKFTVSLPSSLKSCISDRIIG